MSDELRKKLLPKFRETTGDRIEKIQGILLDLEKRTAAPDDLQELARELHTIKGEARIMGFVGISQVIHAAEDLLKSVAASPTGEAVDALLKVCDAVPPLIDAPVDGGPEAAAMVERLRGLAPAAPPKVAPRVAPPRPAEPAARPAAEKPAAPAATPAPKPAARPAARASPDSR